MSKPLNILICDTHTIFCNATQMILSQEFPHVRTKEIACGWEALEEVKRNDWDLVILDLRLPDSNGLEILQEIRAYDQTLPILAFSSYSEKLYGYRVMRSGGSGYLRKNCSTEEFIYAVKKILTGRKYVSPALAEHLAYRVAVTQLPTLHDGLSDRELEILRLIGQGNEFADIAKKFNLHTNTIRSYRVRILKKLQLKTTADLVHYAIQHLEQR